MNSNTEYKEHIIQTIQDAGALALQYHARAGELRVDKKRPKDLVTEADVEVEQFIRSVFSNRFPDIGFWGEESGETEERKIRWIVDPIDGTHSFFRKQYFWSISIALEIEGIIEVGAVYAPALDDLYVAERSKGAWKNGENIKVSAVDKLEEAMVATGFACLRDGLANNNLERFSRVAMATRDQRRFGSAALDLCMVADGQIDAFWEQHLNLYDVAAGCLIASEAGGIVCDFSGNRELNPEEILVTNGVILDELLTLM